MAQVSENLERLRECCQHTCTRILVELQAEEQDKSTPDTCQASRDYDLDQKSSSITRKSKDSLLECGRATTALLKRQVQILHRKSGDWDLLHRRLSDLLSISNDKFYAFPFKDVPTAWRRLYTDASILKACAYALRGSWEGYVATDSLEAGFDASHREEMIKGLDMAIIMAGAPGEDRRELIEEILSLLGPFCTEGGTEYQEDQPRRKRRRVEKDDEVFSRTKTFIPELRNPIPRHSALSLAAFENHMHKPADPSLGPEPLIITDAISHWPARHERPWNKPSYLLSRTLGGQRLIPVEVGRSYVDEGWGQRILPMRDFLSQYLSGPSPANATTTCEETPSNPGDEADTDDETPQTGYLAQHNLFSQIPSLRNDISIPDYCYSDAPAPHASSPLAQIHAAQPHLDDPLLNAWFGPAGTISPLHVDPYHNILTQVVGAKYVRLYAPRESGRLHARGVEDGGVDMGNTSELDVGVLEGWDGSLEQREEERERFAGWENVPFVECVLEEGEALYIPVGWWHYVRSLSVSFSVSFWWN